MVSLSKDANKIVIMKRLIVITSNSWTFDPRICYGTKHVAEAPFLNIICFLSHAIPHTNATIVREWNDFIFLNNLSKSGVLMGVDVGFRPLVVSSSLVLILACALCFSFRL
jgi:hypothetical protein